MLIPGQGTQCAPEEAPYAPPCLPLPVGLLDFCLTRDGPSQWGVADIHAERKAPDSREGVRSRRTTIVFRNPHLLRLEQRYAPEEFLPSQPLVFQGGLRIVFEKLPNSTIMKTQHPTRCQRKAWLKETVEWHWCVPGIVFRLLCAIICPRGFIPIEEYRSWR